MSTAKLRAVHVVIIGSFACLAVAIGLYSLVIKKSYGRIGALDVRYQAALQTWQRKASVEQQLEAAKENTRVVTWRYEKYLREKMPPISFQDRAQGMIVLWKEQSETLGPLLQAWPRKTGVTLASSVQVPAAPVNPNAIDTSLIRIPIGTFRVVGDFSSILAHIRSWNKFNRLVQIDSLSLTGPSPWMTAEYGLTVYIFPRGETGQNVAMAGAATGAGGMPAPMPGAMPAPMPGAMPARPGP